MFNKDKNPLKVKKEIAKCDNKSCYICKNFILDPTSSSNALSVQLKQIPLKLICQEAGLTENQTAIVLNMSINIAKDYLIDDWDSKLLEILILLLRNDFSELEGIPRNQLTSLLNAANSANVPLPFNNITETNNIQEPSKTVPESSNNFDDDTARNAQHYCRNKDLYLMLVNTAVYGNFNYKYYENETNYHKSAEYFALCGFGDSLDQIYQFDNIGTESQLRQNKCVNLETKPEKFKLIPEAGCSKASLSKASSSKPSSSKTSSSKAASSKTSSSKAVPLPIPVSTAATVLNQFQPAYWGIPPYPSTQVQVPNQNYWPKYLNFLTPQQILLQSYLASRPTPSLIPNYPSMMQPTPPVLYPVSSPFQFFNETFINTSIIQQQQQYNFVGATNGNVYDLFYSQMQKTQQITQTVIANKFDTQPRAITSSNITNNDSGSSSGGNNSSNNGNNVKKQSYLNVAKSCMKTDASGAQKCLKPDLSDNNDEI